VASLFLLLSPFFFLLEMDTITFFPCRTFSVWYRAPPLDRQKIVFFFSDDEKVSFTLWNFCVTDLLPTFPSFFPKVSPSGPMWSFPPVRYSKTKICGGPPLWPGTGCSRIFGVSRFPSCKEALRLFLLSASPFVFCIASFSSC